MGITSYPLPVVLTSGLCMLAWLGLAMRDIVQQRKLNPVPCDPDSLGRSSGAYGITRCVRVRVPPHDVA